MNICFLHGKIISKIQFDFFYNSKRHISVVKFDILLNQKIGNTKCNIKIHVKGYDSLADRVYKGFSEGDNIALIGYIEENGVIISNIEY